jgi:hypothetical protein
MLEFALVCMFFLLIMNQVITNASREGARYGVMYQTNTSGTRIPPSSFSPSISDHLLLSSQWNLRAYLPSDANPQVSSNSTW